MYVEDGQIHPYHGGPYNIGVVDRGLQRSCPRLQRSSSAAVDYLILHMIPVIPYQLRRNYTAQSTLTPDGTNRTSECH